MSFGPFPERVNPHKLFARNGLISGEISLVKFQRLAEYLTEYSGQVKVRLEFSCDENDCRIITGHLNTRVSMLCQRCLQDALIEVKTTLRVVVLGSDDETGEMSSGLDSIVADAAGLDLLALIEDELILSLPIVAYHVDGACSVQLDEFNQASIIEEKSGNKAFAKLKEELKASKFGNSAGKD